MNHEQIVFKIYSCPNFALTLLTIETDVGRGQEDGDEAGEHPGHRYPRPQDRDGEDDQGRAEVHRVKHRQPHHQAGDRRGSLMDINI